MTGNSDEWGSTSVLDQVDVPHQLLFVSPADGNFHFFHLYSVLEGVNVLNAAQIHDKVSADTHKPVCGELL
jgi:hypothetical protein